MLKNTLLPVALIAALLTGCAAIPTGDIKIETEAAPKANFSGYTSYAWLGAATIVHDPKGQWEPPGFDADTEIKHLIDRELRARGMSESSDEPDLVIAFAAGIDMQALKLKTDPESDLGVLSRVPQGALLIVMVDSATGFVIWAGQASGRVLSEVDAATAKGRLDYAVTKLIQQLPD